MPIHQFRTYDLIVDIVPGALAIILLLPLPPLDSVTIPTTDGILAATILLLGGFLAGRLLHTISSLIEKALFALINRFNSNITLNDYIETGQPPPPDTDTDNNADNTLDNDTIDPAVLTTVVTTLQTRMTDPKRTRSTPDAIKRYGETLLYDHVTLHHRYETLTTFYRSLTILFLAATLLYTSYGIHLFPANDPVPLRLYAVTALLVLAIVTAWRYTVFTRRRNHASINDLHRHLTD